MHEPSKYALGLPKLYTFQGLMFPLSETMQQDAWNSLQLNGAVGLLFDFQEERPQMLEKAPRIFAHWKVP